MATRVAGQGSGSPASREKTNPRRSCDGNGYAPARAQVAAAVRGRMDVRNRDEHGGGQTAREVLRDRQRAIARRSLDPGRGARRHARLRPRVDAADAGLRPTAKALRGHVDRVDDDPSSGSTTAPWTRPNGPSRWRQRARAWRRPSRRWGSTVTSWNSGATTTGC